MAKNTIERAGIRMLMSAADSVTSGAAGVAAAIVMLESQKLIWIRVDQSPASCSAQLPKVGGQRPDFIAREGAEPIFMDAKTHTPFTPSPGRFHFSLEEGDWQRPQKTETVTGIPVGVLVWGLGPLWPLPFRLGRPVRLHGVGQERRGLARLRDARSRLSDT